jgi:2-hydroxychromene-2-carboxylate isomerase
MTPKQLGQSAMMRLVASRWLPKAVHLAWEGMRLVRREPHKLLYFHQMDDPYSFLTAQALKPLLETYRVELVPYLVRPPTDDNAPERKLLKLWARRDAADVAPHYGLQFTDRGEPSPTVVHVAQRILSSASPRDFPGWGLAVSRAAWSGDTAVLKALANKFSRRDAQGLEAALQEGTELRDKLGHFAGSTFFFGGEWYWGVDRLVHLETRLDAMGLTRPGEKSPRFDRRREFVPQRTDASDLTLEMFVSLRSPYSAIAMPRVMDLAREAKLNLIVRPVLPMVMRGAPLPTVKGLYLIQDAKREADYQGVPFGKIVDPLGRPVERAYSLFSWARSEKKEAAYIYACLEGAFMQGIDLGSKSGLQKVVENAGLEWDLVKPMLDSDDWRPEFEKNRRMMYQLGLWGVPSFRLRGPAGERDYVTWGQDRIWRIAQEVARRAPVRTAKVS